MIIISEHNLYTKQKYDALVKDIVDASRSGKLVFFIGAGVSIAQGYGNWDEYVKNLISYWKNWCLEHSAKYGTSRGSYSVFDVISGSNQSNKRKVDLTYQVIKKILHNTPDNQEFNNIKLGFEKNYFNSLPAYNLTSTILSNLVKNDAIYITTNYDNEIENHLETLRNGPHRVLHDLNKFKDNEYKLELNDVLHIHGSPNGNPEYFIASSADYKKLYISDRGKYEKLKKWFRDIKPTVVFIGLSLEEDEILSLLPSDGNTNYALMKADTQQNETVNKEYRETFSQFFKDEYNIDIFWYGYEFKDLPTFIEKLSTSISKKLDISPSEQQWYTLINPETNYENFKAAFFNISKSAPYIKDLYKKSLNDNHLADYLIKLISNNDYLNTVINYREFWNFINNKFEILHEEQTTALIKFLLDYENYLSKITYYYEFFKVYKTLTDSQAHKDILKKLTNKISNNSDLVNTDFANIPELLGMWFIKVLKKETVPYIYGGENQKMDFSESQIEELSHNLSTKYFYSNDKLLNYFYKLILNNAVTIEKTSLLDDVPTNLLESIAFQQILVKIDNEDSTKINPKLLNRLIKSIDFNCRSFGACLNSFIERHKNELNSYQLQDEYIDAITVKEVRDLSLITEADILNKSENDLLKLIKYEDHLPTAEDDQFSYEKTVDGTYDFFFSLLHEKSEVANKVVFFLKNKVNDLPTSFNNIYLKISTDMTIPSEYRDDIIKTYLRFLLDHSKFSYSDQSFFSFILLNDGDSNKQLAIDNLLKFDLKALEKNDDSDELTLDMFYNTDIGRYVDTLLKMNDKDLILKKLKNISKYYDYCCGFFIENSELDDLSSLPKTPESLLGYLQHHQRFYNEHVSSHFEDVIKELVSSKIDFSFTNFVFLSLLNQFSPDLIKINWKNNNFSEMIRYILNYEKSFTFEKEWFKEIISNKRDITTFINTIKSKSSNLNKISTYLNILLQELDKNLDLTPVNIFRFSIFLKDTNADSTKKIFLLKLLIKILEKNKLLSTPYVYGELVEIFSQITDDNKNLLDNLYNSLASTSALTATEKDRLKELLRS